MEKIYIQRFKKDPCEDCETKDIYDECDCEDNEKYHYAIKRQDIIKKISKKLFELNAPSSWVYDNAPKEYIDLYNRQAEKILDAILE